MRISQREARRLRARVKELERLEESRRNGWRTDYPGGINICVEEKVSTVTTAAVKTARMLKHAVVVVQDADTLRFYALPL